MEQFISTQEFVQAFREAFGEKAELPLVFGFADEAAGPQTPKVGGCLFKTLDMARKGHSVSLSAETVSCGGGKFYTGFSGMPERIPDFVSLQEHYKETPEMVRSFVEGLDQRLSPKPFINFIRVDRAQSFEGMEGLLFFATPDVLSGLAAWAFFDSNDPQAVAAPFGSGCSVMLQMAVKENRDNGSRTFLGLFDPSVRPYIAADELGFVIPRSRFRTMQHTLRRSCLFDTHAWQKVRTRISHPDNIIHTQKYYSPCGNLILGSFGDRLCLCDWEKSPHRAMTDKRLRKSLLAEFEEGTSDVLRNAAGQLDAYFAGKRPSLSVPMLFAGSGFQKSVWQALAEIPYGDTVSYGGLARRTGHPTAVRAVANAVGANPISIFAPCHRVIGSDRSLTGYAGGLRAKQFLLQLESDADLLF